ncbi:hypothetical protein B5M09_010196, partial [Aphanomyces astaci]
TNGTLANASSTILLDANTSSLHLPDIWSTPTEENEIDTGAVNEGAPQPPSSPNGGDGGATSSSYTNTTKVNGVALKSGKTESAPTISILLGVVAAVGAAAVVALIVYNRRRAQLEDSKDDIEAYNNSSRDFRSILQTGQSHIAVL